MSTHLIVERLAKYHRSLGNEGGKKKEKADKG